MKQIVRRPHGPINQAFGRMWFDKVTGKVRFDWLADLGTPAETLGQTPVSQIVSDNSQQFEGVASGVGTFGTVGTGTRRELGH